MSVGVITGDNRQALYCDTTEVAFGPTFGVEEDVESFIQWLDVDPRAISVSALIERVDEWRKQQEADDVRR